MVFLPEQTIPYKTFAKRTMVDGLTGVFKNHPDALLQRTQATIEFPRKEVDYPAVLVRFYERSIFNAGVAHEETTTFIGQSDSIEVHASTTTPGSVQLTWPEISGANGYKLYRGTTSNQENQSFVLTDPSFTDDGQQGRIEGVPTLPTATLDIPQPTAVTQAAPTPNGSYLPPGNYYYRVTALEPSVAVKFQHYFYTADVEFAVYALSALDRDLVADTLVQTIAMGKLQDYTHSFFDRVYAPTDLFPDAQWHFIAVNSDQIQGFGESETQVPWAAEDDLMYSTSYRIGLFGELYSLPPQVTYAVVEAVTQYPYVNGWEQPGGPATGWVSNYPGL